MRKGLPNLSVLDQAKDTGPSVTDQRQSRRGGLMPDGWVLAGQATCVGFICHMWFDISLHIYIYIGIYIYVYYIHFFQAFSMSYGALDVSRPYQ